LKCCSKGGLQPPQPLPWIRPWPLDFTNVTPRGQQISRPWQNKPQGRTTGSLDFWKFNITDSLWVNINQVLSFSQSLNMLLDCGASLSRPVTFDLCLTISSVTVSYGQRHRWTIYKFVRVYSSKTSMSDACFHNFDFNRMIYTAISTDDLPSALANLVVKTPFPAFFACLFKSSFTPSEDSAILCELFGQSFANRFLQNRDFFSTHRNSIPYMRGVLMCLLGFWPSGQKPCGGNNLPL